MNNEIIIYQLFETDSSTYTYILADKISLEAAIIDPVIEMTSRDLKLIEELGLNLKFILETHIHADHITGASLIKKQTNAKIGVSSAGGLECVDMQLKDGQEIFLGNKIIKVIATPGHTSTCITFSFAGCIFTGDSLMIRGCGRTDFQEGSADILYESIYKKLYVLPDDTLIYPAHDYHGQTHSTLALEKLFNPRLGLSKTKKEFIKLMTDLKLELPKKISIAVPANRLCGAVENKSFNGQG